MRRFNRRLASLSSLRSVYADKFCIHNGFATLAYNYFGCYCLPGIQQSCKINTIPNPVSVLIR